MAKAKRVSSWGDIDPKVFKVFEKKVEALREQMIPRDVDNDSPIEVIIIDKRTHVLTAMPVPRNEVYSYEKHGYLEVHPDKQREMDIAMERELVWNLTMATNAMDSYMKDRQRVFYDEQDKKRPLKTQIKEACPQCREGVPFEQDEISEFRKQNPDYPRQFHVKIDDQTTPRICRSFDLRRYEWKLKKSGRSEDVADPIFWCKNPKCRCRLPEHNSRKGVEDKFICSNPFCKKDNTKEYAVAKP